MVRYSVTTRDPGASDVFTCFFTVRPRSTAFLARRPAASSTPGLEVLVHEVIAAIITSPEPTSRPSRVLKRLPRSSGFLEKPFSAAGLAKSSVNFAFTLPISMRSCGRFGPASEGVTVPRSSSITSL